MSGELNAHLSERFSRERSAFRTDATATDAAAVSRGARLNTRIREYFASQPQQEDEPRWRLCPEVPSSFELLDLPEDEGDTEVTLPVNNIKGAWPSKSEYLKAHYELLREDAVRPLREAILQVKVKPTAAEADHSGSIGIYEKAHITGLTCSTKGLGVRISFSTMRSGKKIQWEQSKRLIAGSLLAMTPADDMFQSKVRAVVVAARPLSLLNQNPPEFDVFFARPEEAEIDPSVEWLIVEGRTGFYEADRHTLLALNKMAQESFPLAEHLVDMKTSVQEPEYVRRQPCMNLTQTFAATREAQTSVDILQAWPTTPSLELDQSQLDALRRILTKRIAIIQGPPGTGKTHVSVVALKTILTNMGPDDPPIIVSCQTNHALDQLLRHLALFEKDFIRLGGRTSDRDLIKKRTLFEVRMTEGGPDVSGSSFHSSRQSMRNLAKDMAILLSPFEPGKGPLDHLHLRDLGLLSVEQSDSLDQVASEWAGTQDQQPEFTTPLGRWLRGHLIKVEKPSQPDDFGFDFEEAELESEQLKEAEAETAVQDDDEIEMLKGPFVGLADNYTCRRSVAKSASDDNIRKLLATCDNLWKVPEALRGSVYRYLQRLYKARIVDSFRQKAKIYDDAVLKRKIGSWEQDVSLLRRQKIIGLTTTGLSKYRALIDALQPRVVLVEEAAETREAPVIAACVPSLQHLILVGDHQQLRPHCHVKELEAEPYNLSVSLFEKLVTNGVEYNTLVVQRRMIPEIRRTLYPIYGTAIKDHPNMTDVSHRPPVPGMAGVNSFFFLHTWPESRDESMSCFNPQEADMLVGFYDYLVLNGIPACSITVLTFYNGQRKTVVKRLRQHPNLRVQLPKDFKVVTVDSYQGEENDIILLSLVRSNDSGQLGFLNIANRICVALSRAKRGFYLFGNGRLLSRDKTWLKVMNIMVGKGPDELDVVPLAQPKQRLAPGLPVTCTPHGMTINIKAPTDWDTLNGGCKAACTGFLPCGHKCKMKCHPFPHIPDHCYDPCRTRLPCGHTCSRLCRDQPCHCASCNDAPTRDAAVADLSLRRPDSKFDQITSSLLAPFPAEAASDWELQKPTKPVPHSIVDSQQLIDVPTITLAMIAQQGEVDDLISFGGMDEGGMSDLSLLD